MPLVLPADQEFIFSVRVVTELRLRLAEFAYSPEEVEAELSKRLSLVKTHTDDIIRTIRAFGDLGWVHTIHRRSYDGDDPDTVMFTRRCTPKGLLRDLRQAGYTGPVGATRPDNHIYRHGLGTAPIISISGDDVTVLEKDAWTLGL